jgi:bla regulator protein BlaR1
MPQKHLWKLLNRRKTGICLVLASMFIAGSHLRAQTAASQAAVTPAYDVAVIKPNKSGGNGIDITFSDHGTFSATNATVRQLIEVAFRMRHDLVFDVPKWAQEEHFDIEAKMSGADKKTDAEMTREQRSGMLQALLVDRFQLKAHKETRTLPIYELVVGKGGIKMTAVETAKTGPSGFHGGPGNLKGISAQMGLFAQVLSNDLSSVVIDKTELTGRYDFTLIWSRDETSPTDDAPSIFTAVQEQLGLKLQPTKGPVEVLVVDKVERPSEN